MSLITENMQDLARVQRLLETWKKPLAEVSKVYENFNFEKKIALAKLLENTNAYLNFKLTESKATQSGDIGQFKRFALDVLTVAVPNLIAFDIVSVQPISNRVGMINFLEYQYHTTKGATTEGAVFTDAFRKGHSDPLYTSSAVVEAFDGEAGATQVFTPTWTPVVSVEKVLKNGVALDKSKVVFNKDNGTVTVTDTILATDKFKIAYSYNNEIVPRESDKLAQIGLEMKSLPVTAKARHLAFRYSFEASYELQKEYSFDIKAELSKQAAGELNHEIDIEICNKMYEIAKADADLVWSKTQALGVNIEDHYFSFGVKLTEGATAIYEATQRVGANFIVIGPRVLPVISNVRGFQASGVVSMNGPYYAGTLNGLKVYVNPSMRDVTTGELKPYDFILGYKGAQLWEAGIVYSPYMPIMQSELVTTMDMMSQSGLVTMYAITPVNPHLYIRGKITA